MESIAYEDALRIVLAQCRPLPSEIVGISQSGGRVLARSFRAREDDPPQPKSGMDGFALQSKDTAPATPERPITLSFDEVVGAGHQALREVAPGQAVRIMTGALLPPGADAVVKQEHTRSNGPGRFSVTVPLNPGQNVVPVGAHLRAGTLLQEAGEVLTPHGVSLLAGQGLAQIPVHRRPRVGLLALGDELVVPGGELAPGQIFVSNPYLLEALAREAGAEPVLLGVVPDSLEVIEARLRQALGGGQGQPPCEVVVTLGGSHLGDFDFGWKVQDRLGAQVRFQRVRLNIGGSSLFGTLGDALCFGLPGPPPAAWIGFET
ncbi:MAG: molybdopterin molybdotransferase MoeA, partial [Deltaproteobacteria bacterium]|nr:molybdopterin molybdotransferase MoeA [Deltaproteobacteria bacterium]